MQPVAFIPSPSQGVWHLGPVPIRAYALMIILGIVVAVWLGEHRWKAKGGTQGFIIDLAVWAVPFGLVGGRLYHVITDYQRYFGEGRDPVDALKIWEGGLGIWGAVLFGALGAWIGCRRHGISLPALGDAVAPGIALGQAIGRWGNYWNQELYGRPLDTFWALEIDQAHRPRLEDGSLNPQYADIATYHPTFLYESLWCVAVAALVIWADRRYKLTHGRAFALYLAGYTVGRFWIEWLRIDDAHHILGMRLNDWTALLVFLGAVGYLYWARDKTGPEAVTSAPATEPPAETESKQAEPEPEKPQEAEPEAAPKPEPEKVELQKAETSEEKPEEPETPEKAETSEEKPEEPETPEKAETSEEEPEKAEAPEMEKAEEPEETPEKPEAPEKEKSEAKEPAPESDPGDESASASEDNDAEDPGETAGASKGGPAKKSD